MSDVTLIPVSTVAPVVIPKGMIAVTVSAKETKKTGAIDPSQKKRAIVIPEWTPNVSSKYVSTVCEALHRIAKDQLAAIWKDADPKEIAAALFTEDSLLAYAARIAESSRLTKESVEAWFIDSEFRKNLASKYSEKQIQNIGARLQNLAAPVPSYSEAQYHAVLSLFAEFDSTEDEFLSRLNTRAAEKLAKMIADRESLEESDSPI